MNCLAFRRICLSEPSHRSEAFLAHLEECGDCQRFAEGVGVLDGKLRAAMQVPVPKDLAARIKLRHVIGDEERTRRVRPWQYALAASLMLSVTIGGFLGYRVYSADRYINELRVAVLDHIKQEPDFLAASNHASPAKFKRVMAAFGGQVMDDVAPVRNAEICALKDNNEPIVHAVLQGKMGAVTVLYLKGDTVKDKVKIDDQRFTGVLLPAGKGNMAVVGERNEPIDVMADKLRKSIIWKI